MTDEQRQVPYDVEIEQALLGAILVDNRALDRAAAMKAEFFYDPLHRRIFDTMRSLDGAATITPLTLAAAMKTDPAWEELGLTAHGYFANLACAAPALANVRDYTNILHELAVSRGLIVLAETVAESAYAREKPSQAQIEDAERALYELAGGVRFGEGPLDFAESLRRTVNAAERAQVRGGNISGVGTGFTDIDSLLGGLQPSDLIIVAGRPGMGKTALATNMAFHAARTHAHDVRDGAEISRGAPVLFFSLEMAAQQISARIMSEQTEIEMWKIRNGRLSESEWERFVLTMQELSSLPLYIDDTGGINVAQIAARARRMKRERNIGVVVVDHIQLVAGGARRGENRVQELTEISKALKMLAKELDVPVIALSQLSRGVDSRDDKRPLLSDLRESGSIEQDADVVMFVYREEYYLQARDPQVGTPEHGKWMERMERAHRRADVMIEKHRHGATNKVELYFDSRFTRFSNMVKQ